MGLGSFSGFFPHFFSSFLYTLTGKRASRAMLDVRLLCEAEFVVGIDSVATSFCPLLRASSQTFSTPLPFCCGWLACMLNGEESDYQ